MVPAGYLHYFCYSTATVGGYDIMKENYFNWSFADE